MTDQFESSKGRASGRSFDSSGSTSAGSVQSQSFKISSANFDVISQFLYTIPGILYVSSHENSSMIEVWGTSDDISSQGLLSYLNLVCIYRKFSNKCELILCINLIYE